MDIPSPHELLAGLRELPAGRVLLERLGGRPDVSLVGGAVRDLLLGRLPTELDLVIEGDAVALARELDPGARVHERFGTATFSLDSFHYDLASARTETYPHPGALPEVRPARLSEDLRRRDFTVNAFALRLAGAIEFDWRAPGDLGARRLRVLHEESFIDDPTRLFRLVRYASRLGFALEGGTAELAAAAIREGAPATVTGARTGAELRLLAREPDPVAALAALGDLGLAATIHPRFGLADTQRVRDALALQALAHGERPDLLALGAASERVGAGPLAELLDRLAFEASERELIVAVATGSKRLAQVLAAATRPSEIAAAVGANPVAVVALAGASGADEQARLWLGGLRELRLSIDGSDLIAAGVPEGPRIGHALRATLAAKLDGECRGREAELEHALRAAAGTG